MAAEPVALGDLLGNFVSQDAPSYGDILNCMHCGLCLPTCPTYSLTGRERSSPRGRIALMKGVADGRLDITKAFADEMYFCLGCLACQTACPAGVTYGSLLESARSQITAQKPQALPQRIAARLAFWAFEQPAVLRFGGRILSLIDRLGLRDRARKLGLLKLLPGQLGEMERLLPPLPAQRSSETVPAVTPAKGEQVARVGVLLGCVMDVLCGPENEATVRVLARNGCEVVAPDCGCCGALHAHAGDLPRARRLAKGVIQAFEQADVEAVVLNSAGCGAAMKDYGHWFANDPEWAARARALSAKVVDLTEWFAVHGLRQAGLRGIEQRVTYHDACHLNHAQGVNAPPRQVLGAIPRIDLVEMPEAGWCCGSAGIYNITHFAEAVQLLDRKMANVERTGAQIVVTGNPGCLLQLRYGVQRAGLEIEALHTATLLDRAYGGTDG